MLMLYRRLDQNGDYVFGNNKLDYISGKEAVAQAIKTKIMLFYQEWWENISAGIPMFQSIVGKVADVNLQMAITLLVTNRVQEIPEVVSVKDVKVNSDSSNRVISLELKVDTIYGEDYVGVEF